MSRPGVNFEQVALAAQTLIDEGRQPTIQAVRHMLGTGSPNTIHRHLTTFNEQLKPKTAIEIPAELATAFLSAMNRSTSAIIEAKDEEILSLQNRADELSVVGEALEDERDSLLAQMLALTSESDRFDAIATERQTEIERLLSDLVNERHHVEEARLVITQHAGTIENQSEKITSMGNEITALRIENSAIYKAQQQADQSAAVAHARLESSEKAFELQAEALRESKISTAEAVDRAQRAEQSSAVANTRLESLEKALAVQAETLKESKASTLEAIERVRHAEKSLVIERASADATKKALAIAEKELITLRDKLSKKPTVEKVPPKN